MLFCNKLMFYHLKLTTVNLLLLLLAPSNAVSLVGKDLSQKITKQHMAFKFISLKGKDN